MVVVGAAWRWRDRIELLILAQGENSTPFLASFVLIILTSVGAWLAWRRGWGAGAGPRAGRSVGLSLAALALALGGADRGVPAADNYYATKLAEGGVVGGVARALRARVRCGRPGDERRRRWSGAALRGTAMLGLAVLLGALPVGRSDGPLVGPSVLAQRLLEAHRASGQVQLILAARLAGSSTGDASAILDPGGWFHPVAHRAAPGRQLPREAVTAAVWLATLRGVRSEADDDVAACFGGRGGLDSLPCVQAWLLADPARTHHSGGRPRPHRRRGEDLGALPPGPRADRDIARCTDRLTERSPLTSLEASRRGPWVPHRWGLCWPRHP